MKVILTGFEPFAGEKRNPSQEIVEGFPKKIGNIEIIKLVLPVVRWQAFEVIKEAVENFQPDIVLSVGQAGGRCEISVEQVAVNLDDYRIPDNGENQPMDEQIAPDGPDAYFCTVPVKKMVKAICREKIPAVRSLTAGTFVCNHVMYSTLHFLRNTYPNIQYGFIHIPYMPEQVTEKQGMPSMSLELSAKAVEAAIKIFLE